MAANPALATRLAVSGLSIPETLRRALPRVVVATAALGWAGVFGWLSVERYLAGGAHAEDLGFTDQVLNNFLRGQWFRLSIYQGATWNTELNVGAIARPDSLLAFHVEPMLLAFVPLYALGAGASALLVLQAFGFAAGAVPAYRLGVQATGSAWAATAVALAYLLSPFGQAAVLSDFHTSTLAAPLVLAATVWLVEQRTWPVLVLAGLAMSAREDVAPAVALLGVLAVLGLGLPRRRTVGLALLVGGIAWSLVCVLIIRSYSGGLSPFETRYADLDLSAALTRPLLIEYMTKFLLGGGWLALVAPFALLPALPGLLLNVLSSSPWMASGQAHYSVLVLPFVIVAAALGLARLRDKHLAAGALLLTSGLAYMQTGGGPMGGNYSPASITPHAVQAQTLAEQLPADASISATSSLVPRLTRRAHVYVFPAVLDAEYVFVDLQSSPAPTSAGDVFLRVQSLLESGEWSVARAADGLLLLRRAPPAAAQVDITSLGREVFPLRQPPVEEQGKATSDIALLRGRYALTLLDARLLPAPDAAIDVDGPHWVLHTTWRAPQTPPPPGTRMEFWVDVGEAEPRHIWDIAQLWWRPPATWAPGEIISVDVPDIPVRTFRSWQGSFV